MVWAAVVIVGLLAWIAYVAAHISRQLVTIDLLLRAIARTNAAGLGVNIADEHGYLDGGHLDAIVHYVRERQRLEREERNKTFI